MRASQYIGGGMAATFVALLTACGSTPPNPNEAGEELVVGQMLDIDYDEDRVICRRQRVFGSHVPKTICKTESQIAAEREAAQKSLGPLRPMTGTLQRDPGADPHR